MITFAIPYYSGLAYLQRTIESVLGQSDDSWSALLVDDSPKQEAADLVQRIGQGRVRYAPNERNLGMAATFNRCIDLAETDLVTVLHADDELAPTYTRIVGDALARHPDATAAYTGIDVIGEASQPSFSLPHFVKGSINPARRRELVLDGEPGVRALLRGNFIPAATLCLRRSRLGARRFRAHYKFVLDWDFTLGILLDGGSIVGVPAHCLRNRAHREAATEQLTREHRRFTEEIELYDEMEATARERGWSRCVEVARARRFTKLHIVYRAVTSLARFDLGHARHALELLRR